jgi:hypothetical protein
VKRTGLDRFPQPFRPLAEDFMRPEKRVPPASHGAAPGLKALTIGAVLTIAAAIAAPKVLVWLLERFQ